jgi:ATP-dependent DNA helicase RecQ
MFMCINSRIQAHHPSHKGHLAMQGDQSFTSKEPKARLEKLKSVFGFDAFREGQGEVIEQVLSGHSSLAIFPTGSGKSLCYQFCALALPHLTVVISPLLALMKDQLAFLHSKGIAAASIDSSQSNDETRLTMQGIRQGEIKLLMVSVERFNNERFRQFLASVTISLLVVDEAHCISEWGHNFRPDYLKIPQYCRDFAIPQALLLTATATKKVKQDMALRFTISPEHIVQTGFYRSNLNLSVLSVPQRDKNQHLSDKLQQLTGAGIVYVTLQQTAESVAAYLSGLGFNASAYHAGMELQKRQGVQEAFMDDRVQIIVATIAFGMGIDKGNIRFVIHYDLPKSIENYSQEIGRAGRDGLPSQCITLANLDGLNTVENFVYGDTPERENIASLLDNIEKNTLGSRWEMQELPLSKLTNIRVLPLKTLLVQLELLGVLTPNHAYYADCRFQFITSRDEVLAMFEGERQTFLKQIFDHTKFKKVWGELDLDGLYETYGHERQRVLKALDYLMEKGQLRLETKKIIHVFTINTQALTSRPLADELHLYFADKEVKEIARIAQLVRFFELTSCLSYALARYFDDHQAPEHCHHCSTCAGAPVTLSHSVVKPMPDTDTLTHALTEFTQLASKKSFTQPTLAVQAKFLMGLTLPSYSRSGINQLSGFGMCAEQRYQDVLSILTPNSD